jgi:hypothetical protein
MPLIAAVAIAAGAIEVSAVVAGLTYASAGLYVVGKATGNSDLLKLSAVAGLAAGATGLYEGLSGVAGAAEAADGASGVDPLIGGTNADVTLSGAQGMAEQGSAAMTSPVPDPSSGIEAMGASNVAAPNTGIINRALDAGPAQSAAGAGAAAGADTAAVDPSASGIIGRAQIGADPSPVVMQQADMDVHAFSPASGSEFQMPTDVKVAADPGALSKARTWWGSLNNSEKLAASQFVAKGLGSIGDFVGPKADLVKAQAGLNGANTAVLQQQLANNAKPASVIPKTSYNYVPR